MQVWLIMALGYALFHAIVPILDKQVLKNNKIDAVAFSTARYGLNAIISFILVLLTAGEVIYQINFYTIILSALYFSAGITYFSAIKIGDVSKLIPYSQSINTLLSFFLATLILNEKFIMSDFAAVALIVLGGYIVWTDGMIVIPKKSPGILLVAASGIFLALHGIVAKYISIEVDPLEMSLYLYTLVTFYFSIIILISKKTQMQETVCLVAKDKKLYVLTFLASLIAVIGTSMLYFALSLQNAAKVLPFSGLPPLFTTIIGWLILKEKHGPIRILGSILLIFGVYMLST